MVISKNSRSGNDVKSIFQIFWERFRLSEEKLNEFFVDTLSPLFAIFKHATACIYSGDIPESVIVKVLANKPTPTPKVNHFELINWFIEESSCIFCQVSAFFGVVKSGSEIYIFIICSYVIVMFNYVGLIKICVLFHFLFMLLSQFA